MNFSRKDVLAVFFLESHDHHSSQCGRQTLPKAGSSFQFGRASLIQRQAACQAYCSSTAKSSFVGKKMQVPESMNVFIKLSLEVA